MKNPIICNLSFEGLMEYLSNNRGRNCSDKWSTHKLYRKWINAMILIIFFWYTVHFNVAQNAMHYYILHKVKVNQ